MISDLNSREMGIAYELLVISWSNPYIGHFHLAFLCPSQVANFSEAGGLRSKWRRSQSVVSGVRIVETPDEQRLGRWKVVGFPLVVR